MSDNALEELADLTQWTPIEAIPDGHLLAGQVGKEPVFIWRTGALLRAYGATCPHLGAPLNEGIVVDGALRCPWHHACFDMLTGEATAAPAFDSLTSYAVDLEEGRFALRPARAPTPPRPAVRWSASNHAMAIVGGGAAGFAAADGLRREGWRGEIAMYSSEADRPYDRTLLTKDYLDGNFGDDRLPIAQRSLTSLGIDFEGEAQVERVDVENKRLQLADGRTPSYAKLLLATGAAPRKLEFAWVRIASCPFITLSRGLPPRSGRP